MVFYDSILQRYPSTDAESNLSIMRMTEARMVSNECGMDGAEELLESLKFFHNLGFILHYPQDEILKETIFVKPQELIYALRTVISFKLEDRNQSLHFGPNAQSSVTQIGHQMSEVEKNEVKEKGRISNSLLKILWKKYPDSVHIQLKALLVKFGLAFTDPDHIGQHFVDRYLIVPCLVKKEDDKTIDNPATCTYRYGAISPIGLSNGLIVQVLKLAQKSGSKTPFILFNKGCVFAHNETKVKVSTRTGEVQIEVQRKEGTGWPFTLQVSLFSFLILIFTDISPALFFIQRCF